MKSNLNCRSDNSRLSYYRILDLDVSLETDSEEFVEIFERDYGWFRAPSINGGKRLSFSVHLNGHADSFVHTTRAFNYQFSIVNHQSLLGHPTPISYASQIVLRDLFNNINGFFLFHAGVVVSGDGAIIIAGPPGIGKTTLVLRLLKSGFTFFSDDFCPIHKKSGLVHPFPRSVWLADGYSGGGGNSLRRGKVPLRTYELGSAVGEERPCQPKCLICLDPGWHGNAFCELEISLKETGADQMLKDLKRLQDVTVTSVGTGFWEWRIRYPRERGLLTRVRELLAIHEQYIWNLYRVDRIRLDFERDPALTPIPTHEAAFSLLRNLKQGLPLKGKTVNSCQLPGRLFMEINGILEDIPCYRMTVGRLERMAELIEGLKY